jgi:hypothetical protein
MLEPFEVISKVRGVRSVFVVNNRAKIIFEKLSPDVSRNTAEVLSEHIIKIFALGQYGKFKRQSNEIELLYEQGRLLAVDCRRFVLIITCENNTPFSMLRMTMGVQIKNLIGDESLNKELETEVIDKKVLLRKDKLSQYEIDLLEKI